MDLKKYIGGQGVDSRGCWFEVVDIDEDSGLLLVVDEDGGDKWLPPAACLNLEAKDE